MVKLVALLVIFVGMMAIVEMVPLLPYGWPQRIPNGEFAGIGKNPHASPSKNNGNSPKVPEPINIGSGSKSDNIPTFINTGFGSRPFNGYSPYGYPANLGGWNNGQGFIYEGVQNGWNNGQIVMPEPSIVGFWPTNTYPPQPVQNVQNVWGIVNPIPTPIYNQNANGWNYLTNPNTDLEGNWVYVNPIGVSDFNQNYPIDTNSYYYNYWYYYWANLFKTKSDKVVRQTGSITPNLTSTTTSAALPSDTIKTLNNELPSSTIKKTIEKTLQDTVTPTANAPPVPSHATTGKDVLIPNYFT